MAARLGVGIIIFCGSSDFEYFEIRSVVADFFGGKLIRDGPSLDNTLATSLIGQWPISDV